MILIRRPQIARPRSGTPLAELFADRTQRVLSASTINGASYSLPPVGAYGTSSTLVESAFGPAWSFNTTSDATSPASRIEYSDTSVLDIAGELTIVCAFTFATPPTRSNRGIVAKYVGYDGAFVSRRSYTLFLDYQTHASNVYPRLGISSDGASAVSSPTGAHVANGAHCVVATYKPSSYIRLFLDGVMYGETTASVPSSINNSSAPLWIGAQYSINTASGASTYVLNGSISIVEILNVALAPQLAAAISGNPWRLFSDRKRLVPMSSVASSLPTLTSITASAITTTGLTDTIAGA